MRSTSRSMRRDQAFIIQITAAHPRSLLPVILGLVLSLVFQSSHLKADDIASGFDTANKLYEEGKYSAAIAAYDKLLAGRTFTEALYFNRGNAEFKLGHLGRAIASYKQAQRLAPRDPQLRANLKLARSRASGGASFQTERLTGWLTSLSLNEWTLLVSVELWMFFILLALRQWKPESKTRLRNYLFATAGLTVVSGVCFVVVLNAQYWTSSAIVTVGEAEVRNGPLDESPGIFKVRDGMELIVSDKKDGWLQVTDSSQRTGWLRQNQAITVDHGERPDTKPGLD